MHKKQKQVQVTALQQFVAQELEKKEALREYYQRTLDETTDHKQQLENFSGGNGRDMEDRIGASPKVKKMSESFMDKSKFSAMLESPSKSTKNKQTLSRSFIAKTEVTHQAEYKTCTETLQKTLKVLASKESSKPTKSKAPQRNSATLKNTSSISLMNKSLHPFPSKAIESRVDLSTSLMMGSKRMKTQSMIPENNIPLSKKERLTMDLGDVSLLLGDDEIVNNLIANIQKEEEKYVQLIMAQTELTVKDKMANYMNRQTEKYEESIFKLKQEEVEQSLSLVRSNKDTVKCGYTDKMREVVDRGMRSYGVSSGR